MPDDASCVCADPMPCECPPDDLDNVGFGSSRREERYGVDGGHVDAFGE